MSKRTFFEEGVDFFGKMSKKGGLRKIEKGVKEMTLKSEEKKSEEEKQKIPDLEEEIETEMEEVNQEGEKIDEMRGKIENFRKEIQVEKEGIKEREKKIEEEKKEIEEKEEEIKEKEKEIKLEKEKIEEKGKVLESIRAEINDQPSKSKGLRKSEKEILDSIKRHDEAIEDHREAIKDHREAIKRHSDAIKRHGDVINGYREAIKRHGDVIEDHREAIKGLDKAIAQLSGSDQEKETQNTFSEVQENDIPKIQEADPKLQEFWKKHDSFKGETKTLIKSHIFGVGSELVDQEFLSHLGDMKKAFQNALRPESPELAEDENEKKLKSFLSKFSEEVKKYGDSPTQDELWKIMEHLISPIERNYFVWWARNFLLSQLLMMISEREPLEDSQSEHWYDCHLTSHLLDPLYFSNKQVVLIRGETQLDASKKRRQSEKSAEKSKKLAEESNKSEESGVKSGSKGSKEDKKSEKSKGSDEDQNSEESNTVKSTNSKKSAIQGVKADAKVQTAFRARNSYLEFVAFENKKEAAAESKKEADFFKLQQEMKDMMDCIRSTVSASKEQKMKMTTYGCTAAGFSLQFFRMDLPYQGVYRIQQICSFELPKDSTYLGQYEEILLNVYRFWKETLLMIPLLNSIKNCGPPRNRTSHGGPTSNPRTSSDSSNQEKDNEDGKGDQDKKTQNTKGGKTSMKKESSGFGVRKRDTGGYQVSEMMFAPIGHSAWLAEGYHVDREDQALVFKIFRDYSSHRKEAFLHRLLAKLRMPSIAPVLDIIRLDDIHLGQAALVMPKLISLPKPENLSIQQVQKWTKQLLLALKSLHFLGIFHLDIKHNNLLLTSDGDLQLIDFDCSSWWDIWPRHTIQEGTAGFMAPEVEDFCEDGDKYEWNDKEPLFWGAADIWSSGVTILGWLLALMPDFIPPLGSYHRDANRYFFPEDSDHVKEVLQNLDERKSKLNEKLRLGLDLVKHMIVPDSKERFTATQCLAHRFVFYPKATPSSGKENRLQVTKMRVRKHLKRGNALSQFKKFGISIDNEPKGTSRIHCQ